MFAGHTLWTLDGAEDCKRAGIAAGDGRNSVNAWENAVGEQACVEEHHSHKNSGWREMTLGVFGTDD